MGSRSAVTVLIGFVLVSPSATAQSPSRLVPRIGETVQEFEARQRGEAFQGRSSDTISVPADRQGHFLVRPLLNGQATPMIVDTGASVIALTQEDAQRLGARPIDYSVAMQTANGSVSGAPFRIDEVRLGDIVLRDVDAVILPQGRLDVSLLGMSFLRRLGGFEVSRGRLNMRP